MRKIETSEVKRILEMHSKLKKKPILEQNTVPDEDNDVNPNISTETPKASTETPKVDSNVVTPKVNQDEVDLKLIRDAITAKCLKNGKAQYLKGTKKPVYVVTTAKSNKVVVFYPDMTYKFVDGSKSGKWKCSSLETLANAEKQKASEKATVDTDVTRELEQFGWKERKDIPVTDIELSQLYQKHPKYDLYKLKINNAKVGGYTEEQQAFITLWKDKGYLEKLTPEELALGTYKQVKVSGSEGLFPGGLIMYRPAVIVPKISECKDNIKKYYEAFKNRSEELSDSEFNKLKPVVQGCVDKYNGKWGGIFSNVDNYVKVLTGDATGGPLSTGEDSKFRLKSPRNIK